MTVEEYEEKKAIKWEKKNQRRIQILAKELRNRLRKAPVDSSLSDWSEVYLDDIRILIKEWGIY